MYSHISNASILVVVMAFYPSKFPRIYTYWIIVTIQNDILLDFVLLSFSFITTSFGFGLEGETSAYTNAIARLAPRGGWGRGVLFLRMLHTPPPSHFVV